MTREEALLRGSKTYMGHPCGNGHDGKRYTLGKGCWYCKNSVAIRKQTISHHNPRVKPEVKRELPSPHVISSDWIKPPTKQQLMARR